jgi:hypothetical protein
MPGQVAAVDDGAARKVGVKAMVHGQGT